MKIKFFGKFEQDNNRKVYRTKTFLSLDDSTVSQEPATQNIIGTIFMLNPGASKPLASDVNEPFKNYTFNQYVALESDATMSVFMELFNGFQNNENKYTSGLIEIKNLFNYRESSLSQEDWAFIINDIKENTNSLNINVAPDFHGNFVLFAWGSSKLKNPYLKEYAKSIFTKALNSNKKIIYLSSKNVADSEKLLSFYHPLGGHWKSDKRERFIGSLKKVLELQSPVHDFS